MTQGGTVTWNSELKLVSLKLLSVSEPPLWNAETMLPAIIQYSVLDFRCEPPRPVYAGLGLNPGRRRC